MALQKNLEPKNIGIFCMRLFAILLTFFVNFKNSQANQMEYVQFCLQGECRNFSRLVMGTDHLMQGGWVDPSQPEPTQNQVYAVLDEAARLGINLFDTAPIYVGGVENLLGQWRSLRESEKTYLSSNPDGKLYALSKGGFPFDLFWLKELPAGCHSIELIDELKRRRVLSKDADNWKSKSFPLQNVPPGTYASHLYCDRDLMIERISAELVHTCQNLNCRIDVYLMHRDDGDSVNFERIKRALTPVKPILEAVSSEQISKNIFMFGWSNWETHRVNESLSLSRQYPNLVRPTVNSPYFSLLEMSDSTIHALGVQVRHHEMMDSHFQEGIKIMPYSPLGGFSILDKPYPEWESARSDAYRKYINNDPYWKNVFHSIFTDTNKERWDRALKFSKDFNEKHSTQFTLDQFLNAYVLAHPRTDMLAIGAVTVEQVRRTVASLKLAKMLSPYDLEYLYSGEAYPTLGTVSQTLECAQALTEN